jgi:hypothetical protein
MAVRSISTVSDLEQSNANKRKLQIVPPANLGTGEAVGAVAIALIIMSALFVTMPYRGLWYNAIYTTIALSLFYSYLKFRLEIRPPLWMIACPALAVLIDVIGNHFGLFSMTFGILPYDVFAHFVGTGLCFVAVMWLITAIVKRFNYRLPFGLITFFAVATTFSLTAFYEITELWDEDFFHGHRIWSTHDTSHDLASDIAGSLIMAIIYALITHAKRTKQPIATRKAHSIT